MITINDIAKIKELSREECTLDLDNLETEVTGINVMDTRDMKKWIKQGELIIVGGEYVKVFFEDKYLLEVIKKISGIITKKIYKEFISDRLVDLCIMHEVPIFFVDNFFSWSDIMSPIQSLIISNHSKVLQDVDIFYKKMLTTLSEKNSYKDMCEIFYELVGYSVAVIGSNFNLIDYSVDFSWENYVQGIGEVVPGIFKKIGVTYEGKQIIGVIDQRVDVYTAQHTFFYIPIIDSRKNSPYLVIKQEKYVELLTEDVLAKIEIFCLIYRLKSSYQYEYKLANNHYRNLVFEDLLNINESNDNEKNRISYSLGSKIYDSYRIIVIKDSSPKSNYAFIQENNTFIKFREDVLQCDFYDENYLIFSRRHDWIILLPNINKDAESFVCELLNFLQYKYKNSRFYIGVSEVHPYWKLNLALKEAKQAVSILISNYSNKKYLLYNKLGILKMFLDDQGKINQLYVNKMLDTYICPLKEYDNKHRTALFPTLEVFLESGFSHNETSKKLFIHKNTLRARIKRIEQVLEVDISHPDSLMNIYIAMQIAHLSSD
ncbi:MAG TPA: PucR family transcriptional regulator [Candidatus Enterococcus stercoripullorum]|nr:PucR family transcriptional regulator [Candidatus Enterococcus stercoripullorum]